VSDKSSGNGKMLLRIEGLKKYFPVTQGLFRRQVGDVKAVDGLTFDIHRGETLGLVGESGCGKTTTGRTILQLYPATAGQVTLDGTDLGNLKGKKLRQMRRRMQMIFQDPYASLNPRMTVGGIVAAPLKIHGVARGKECQERVAELLELVGLNPTPIPRHYCRQFPCPTRLSSGSGSISSWKETCPALQTHPMAAISTRAVRR